MLQLMSLLTHFGHPEPLLLIEDWHLVNSTTYAFVPFYFSAITIMCLCIVNVLACCMHSISE